MVLIGISSLVLGGWETEQPLPEYFLLPVHVPISEYFSSFQKVVKDSPMVLTSRPRCMILTMVGNFDHLLPTLRLICGVLGRKIIPWLPVLPSQRVVRQRLVLDQIPILWKVKCSGDWEEMDSHLENISGLFIWAPYFNSFEWRYGSCHSIFFHCLCSSFFLRKMTHTP